MENKANLNKPKSLSQANPRDIDGANGDNVMTVFNVKNMDCADEIKAIEIALAMDGVSRVQANLMASTVQIFHSPSISSKVLIEKIETTVVKVANPDPTTEKPEPNNRAVAVGISGLFLIVGLIAEWTGLPLRGQYLSFGITIVVAGSLVFPKAWGALTRFSLDMNVLMAVAVIGAAAIGQMGEAAAVVFLFSLSELLESYSVNRARGAIRELLEITPKKALKIGSDGSTSEVAVETIKPGDMVRARAGDQIPLDGTVVSGSSNVNQAPLTGESLAVAKTKNDVVYAGTINLDGTLDIKVTKEFTNSKISQIIQLVEQAQSERAPAQKFVDQFAKIYTPTVLLFAIGICVFPPLLLHASWAHWLYRSLVLLVIACPCALVISTPVSIVSALAALAKKGVLVKGGAYLEILGKVKALAVDKTGTLTEGVPKVQSLKSFADVPDQKVVAIAASLESHSSHPLALAILGYAKEKNIAVKEIADFKNVSGRGVEASIGGHVYFLGNHRFAHDIGVCTPTLEKYLSELEEKSQSVVVVGHKPHADCAGEVLGVVGLGDAIRGNTKEALQKIRTAGVSHIVMLSGDNQKTANAVGAAAGVDESFGDLLPPDKVERISELKKRFGTVAMIGDGINDAPALASSSVGIAMGAIGTDTAIETADVALMQDDLNQVATAIHIGRRALRIIRFNIAFALFTKFIFLGLAVSGYSNLWIAVAADTGAALLVILNSLRLLRG